jgi:hypothetical protein
MDSDDIISQWGRLGISFYNNSSREVDPERLIIKTIPRMKEDRKLLSLMVSWLSIYSDLIHVERLKQLAKRSLSVNDFPWFQAVGNKIGKSDPRWKILGKIHEEKQVVSQWDELQSRRIGLDPDFENAGLRVAMFASEVEKKQLNRTKVLEMNQLFSIRTLFGTNWRADILWIKERFPDISSYAVAKELGCNTETVYRITKQIDQLGQERIQGVLSSLRRKAA